MSAFVGRNAQNARERTRYGDHSHVHGRRSAPAPQQKRQTQSLVHHSGERVSRINSDRREQWIHLALAIIIKEIGRIRVQFTGLENSYAVLSQCRTQAVVPR